MNDPVTYDESAEMNADTIKTLLSASSILPLSQIGSMDEYLQNYGKILGKKAINALAPLHVPGRDSLPDFCDMLREPFPCQQHVVAAAVKMMDTVGSGFIVGEMGTGKTLLGMTSVHKHASRSRKKGGMGGRYRALVLCPDHLINKWCREIEETIPDAIVSRFGPQGAEEVTAPKKRGKGKAAEKQESGTKRTLRDTVALLDKRNCNRWEKPKGAEWYVLGRNQAKWLSDWTGLSDTDRGFGGHTPTASPSSKHVVVDRVAVQDEKGNPKYNRRGEPIMSNVTDRVHYCPKCGTVARDKKGVPLGSKDLSVKPKNSTQKRCHGVYAVEVATQDRPKHSSGLDKLCPIPSRFAEKKPADRKSGRPADEFTHGGRRFKVVECDEPLYNYTSRPCRWSPARIIQGKMRRFFQYLIIDEVHEQKSDESAQSMACGKLIASVKHTIALTGTIIGGYANHLYPLMMRISPTSLREEGFEWGKDLAFSEAYGRIDRIITTKEYDDAGPSVRGNQKSMRRAKSGSRTERKAIRPGVMPTMFGRHLIGSSMFITLDELADELPDLFEYIGGTPPDEPNPDSYSDQELYEADKDRYDRNLAGWHDVAVNMEPAQRDEYLRVQSILEHHNKELLQRGSMKLLGAYLWTTLDYPDRPFGWGYDAEVLKAARNDENAAPALLGQSFLKNFDHQFEPATETLVLTRIVSGVTETERIKLDKEGGIYWLNVTFNGKDVRRLAYDTGASSISLPFGMADELGLKPKKGDVDVMVRVADGKSVNARRTTIGSVKVGRFAVTDVECTVVPPSGLTHTVGYWEEPGIRTIDNFRGVVTPKDLDQDVVYPKEQKLIDICKQQKADGIQTWVYVQMSGKRNIQPRLRALLESEGLKVGILRADDVEPIERENWIAQHGREFDVMISHPQLVSTGLDLFSKSQGGHNYATIVFYETGYNLFTMRQAARRAWRIGQPRDCRVYYLYYRDTMQHKAMSLMSRKMAAAQALEGEFSEDGLAAMAGEDNLQMALAKSLADRIDSDDMQRSWSKVKSGPKKKPASKPAARPLDNLPVELQLTGESLIESQSRPVPPEAAAEFPKISEEYAKRDQEAEKIGDDLPPDVIEEIEQHKQDIANEEEACNQEPECPFGEGDRVEWTHYGETKTGIFQSEYDPGVADVRYDWPLTAGGVPIKGKQLVRISALRLVAPTQEEIDESDAMRAEHPVFAPEDGCDLESPEALAAKAVKLYEPDDEDEESDIPELTEEILAKMFANMMAAGQWGGSE